MCEICLSQSVCTAETLYNGIDMVLLKHIGILVLSCTSLVQLRNQLQTCKFTSLSNLSLTVTIYSIEHIFVSL